jgi:hypothetical protein
MERREPNAFFGDCKEDCCRRSETWLANKIRFNDKRFENPCDEMGETLVSTLTLIVGMSLRLASPLGCHNRGYLPLHQLGESLIERVRGKGHITLWVIEGSCKRDLTIPVLPLTILGFRLTII